MSAHTEQSQDFDGFDLRRHLEEQKEGGFPETLTMKDTLGVRYRLVAMQGGTAGSVLVIEPEAPKG